MNNDEIAKLAREYAGSEANRFSNVADDYFLVMRVSLAYEATQVLSWLLRTHCIVSKEKVNNEYETSKHYFEATDSSNPTQKQYFYGRMTVVESLFGAETFKNSEI